MNRKLCRIAALVAAMGVVTWAMGVVTWAPGFEARAASRVYGKDDIIGVARGIVAWKKADCGAEGGLLAGLRERAGTSAGDWYAIGVARLSFDEENAEYLSALKATAPALWQNGKTGAARVTDLCRAALAMLALSGDPANVSAGGATYDLIGPFTCGLDTAALKKQGVGGLLWALITLDGARYPVPAGSLSTKDDIITEILKEQRVDGGFALAGAVSDPDMTAMALQALAPYRNAETVYSYTRAADGKKLSKTVRQVTDEAVARLSSLQRDTGDYASFGTRCAETTAQVIVALCSMGLDPQADSRFIKNGITLVDALMLYRTGSGGFSHTLPAKSPDSIASEQALCAMAALWRQASGMRALYDMRPEQSAGVRDAISELVEAIGKITAKTQKSELRSLKQRYDSIPQDERIYVHNYALLADALSAAGGNSSSQAAGSQPAASSAHPPGKSSIAGSLPHEQSAGTQSDRQVHGGASSQSGGSAGGARGGHGLRLWYAALALVAAAGICTAAIAALGKRRGGTAGSRGREEDGP